MPYTPTTWVENVTTLGPTNMNHIEQGIALTSPAYGTSLPGSPSDGQEAILVDSTTNPTYQWRFRYNSGSSSAYKWECVGGAPYVLQAYTGSLTGDSTWHSLNSLTLARAGDYNFTGQFAGSAAASGSFSLGIDVGASPAHSLSWDSVASATSTGVNGSQLLTAIAASSTVNLFSWASAGMTLVFYQLTAMPVRVS